MKKRLFALVTLIVLMLTMTAEAVEPRTVQPRPSLTFKGTTATCAVSCVGGDNEDVELTLTLYRGTTYLKSWYNSGSGHVSISEDYTVESGKTYKLVVSYSVNGKAQPSRSITKTCP